MHSLLSLAVALAAASGPLLAQGYVPAGSSLDPKEANNGTNYPLMRAASRSQYLVAPGEVGSVTTITKISLRYDGPSFGASGGTIGSLDLYLGNGGVAPGQSTAAFDANYTGGLTRVVALQGWTFGADGSVNPDVWGGPSGELAFPLQAPFAYTGGNLVLEIRTSGNSNAGAGVETCLLDAETDPAVGPGRGSWTTNGSGCHGTTAAVAGQLAPGGLLAVHGGGFGPGAPVVVFVGTSRTSWNGFPLPYSLAGLGAPGCAVFNDAAAEIRATADAAGMLPAYGATTFALPPQPWMAGNKLQLQLVGARPGVNPIGVVTSNNVEVVLGTWTALFRGYMAHYHHLDRDARVASLSTPTVLAMRIE